MMQKAQTIMSFWEGMSHSSRERFLIYIGENCSPLKQYYDDDMTEADEEDLKKVTIQIKVCGNLIKNRCLMYLL